MVVEVRGLRRDDDDEGEDGRDGQEGKEPREPHLREEGAEEVARQRVGIRDRDRVLASGRRRRLAGVSRGKDRAFHGKGK